MEKFPTITEEILKEKKYKLIEFKKYNTHFLKQIDLYHKEIDNPPKDEIKEEFKRDVNSYLTFLSDTLSVFKTIVEESNLDSILEGKLPRRRVQRELYDFLEENFTGGWFYEVWWHYSNLKELCTEDTIDNLEETLFNNEPNLWFLQENAYRYTQHDNFFSIATKYFKEKAEITKDERDKSLEEKYKKLADKENKFQTECTKRAYSLRGDSNAFPFEVYWEDAKGMLRKSKHPWKQTNKKSLLQRLFSSG